MLLKRRRQEQIVFVKQIKTLPDYKIIMKKIYLLRTTLRDTSFFMQDCPEGERSIQGRAMAQRWEPFGDDYQPIELN